VCVCERERERERAQGEEYLLIDGPTSIVRGKSSHISEFESVCVCV